MIKDIQKKSVQIWGRRSAFNVQKVLWAADEMGLAVEHIDIGGAAGGLGAADFLALNPNGTIPVLQDENGDDGEVIWESQTIVRYLAAKYGSGTLWPEDPGVRARADRWMDWAQVGFQPAFMRLFWGYYRTPQKDRDQAKIQFALEICIRHLKILDDHLASQDFLGGPTFTMGDIPAATALYRMFEMGVEIPPMQNVEAWYLRLQAREAFANNIMQPFDDLKGRLTF